MNHLLTTYMERNDREPARAIANELFTRKPRCPMCMVNIANLALTDGNVPRAAAALSLAEKDIAKVGTGRLLEAYVLAIGQLRELRGNPEGAESAYRDAIKLQPMDPEAQMNLALLLARERKISAARLQVARALSLFAPQERAYRRHQFHVILDEVLKSDNRKPEGTN